MPQKDTLDRAAYTCMLVSYRRLSPQFQFSLSGVTLVYLYQWSLMVKILHDAELGSPFLIAESWEALTPPPCPKGLIKGNTLEISVGEGNFNVVFILGMGREKGSLPLQVGIVTVSSNGCLVTITKAGKTCLGFFDIVTQAQKSVLVASLPLLTVTSVIVLLSLQKCNIRF